MAQADPGKLKLVRESKRRDILFCLARGDDSRRIVCGSSDGKLYGSDWRAEKPEEKALEGHTSYVTGVTHAGGAGGGVYVSGSYDRHLIWWDSESLEEIRRVRAHDRWIRDVVASPDSGTVASVADDMVCRLWDAASGELRKELRGHEEKTPNHYPSMLFTCAFSAEGKHLATADKVGRIVVWETDTGKPAATLEAPEMYTWDPRQRRHSIGGVRSLAFSPDGDVLAAGGMGQVGNIDHLGGESRIELFDWRRGERLHTFTDGKMKGLVEHLAFHHEGDWLAAAGGDNNGFLFFLDVAAKKFLDRSKAPMHVHEFSLNENSDEIYAVGHQRTVVWELKG